MHKHDVNSHIFTNFIHRALSKCKRSKQRKSETIFFPTNVWFDKDCKLARRKLSDSNKTSLNIKVYKQIIKKEKTNFMITRREELISLGKINPKLFWIELHQEINKLKILLQPINGLSMLRNFMKKRLRWICHP